MPENWYKLARPDGWDFYTGHTINYRAAAASGSIMTCPDYAPTKEYGAGFHLSRNPNGCFAGAGIPCSAYRVEPVSGLMTINTTKSKAHKVRVLEEITDIDTLLGWDYQGLVAYLATSPHTRWFHPDGQPDPMWRLTIGESWSTARSTARSAARGAARGEAWDAAVTAAFLAAWDAAFLAARSVARSAAVDEARSAAVDAAGKVALALAGGAAWSASKAAARAAAGDAAGDAAGVAALYVCEGLPLAPEHRAHLHARWNVWRKGYALLGDVSGQLHVYASLQKEAAHV